MFDQVLFEGQHEPIAIKWAIDSPFDKSEAMRAQQEVQQLLQDKNILKPLRTTKKQKATFLQTQPDPSESDPHLGLTMGQKLKMDPSQLVPQLSNYDTLPASRKRELKYLEKQQDQRDSTFSSEGFDKKLFSGQTSSTANYQLQISDPTKVLENCSKMSSVLQMIDRNLAG